MSDAPPDPTSTPSVTVGALEVFVELLSRAEDDAAYDSFYARMCEAVCRLAHMDRAVIFRYDAVRRRVRAAGAFGLDLDLFTDAHVTVESAPIARQALEQDRVIEVAIEDEADLPDRFRGLLRRSTLVCTPMAAAGRWVGVVLSDRGPGPRPLDDEERHLLWTLGKTAALASSARIAGAQQARAHQLQERIDLARDVHERVIQKVFGVLLALSAELALTPEARERCAAELQEALTDLRHALQRPLGRQAPETHTTLLEEVERLRREHPGLHLTLVPGAEAFPPPARVEALAQSILAEAVRNAHKHAHPTKVEIGLEHGIDTWALEVVNDGVHEEARKDPGVGLRLAAFEALQAGGIVEFGERAPGYWRVRLAVPDEPA